MIAVVRKLKEMGIAAGDIQTQYSSLMPRYRYDSTVTNGVSVGKQVFEAYEAQTSLQVTVRALDKVGEVLQQLTEVGIDRLGNVSYGLVDERPVKERVITEAVQNARRKADIAAAAMGVSVGNVLGFQESGAQFVPMPMVMNAPMMQKAYAMDGAGAPQSAPPAGDIEVSQGVSITYSIKD
jgi:uncharacterized protein